MIDAAFEQGAGDAQVGFLHQVFGDARVLHHPYERAQQRQALGQEDRVEVGSAHKGVQQE